MKKKLILAYSGGLDTSVILKWLIDKGYEVICFIGDVGQKEDFESARKKALAIGASQVVIENLQKEFVENYIFPSIQAHAVYEGKYLLGTALARPLIAKKLVELGQKENITSFAHGATGKGNDQVRFELTILKHIPYAEIISPWKDPEFLTQFSGRPDLLNYAAKHQIPVTSTLAKPYSIDENLMHTSFEGGQLEDPSASAPEVMFIKTTSPQNAPDLEMKIAIDFQAGSPVSVEDNETEEKITGSLEIFSYLNKIGGKHGIGRIDLVESRFVGMKSRGVYETPAGTILLKAHLDLEGLTLDREVMLLKESMAPKIAQLIYNGFWFSPEMDFLMAAIFQSQKNVTGKVFLTLYKGNAIVTGRSSPCSLYQPQIASMDVIGGYDQTDAKGFIKLNALRLMGVPSLDKMWNGRFTKTTAAEVETFTASIFFDQELASVDILGSLAHVQMLQHVGILGRDEAQEIQKGLIQIGERFSEGKVAFLASDEDIHMKIEKELRAIIGPVVGKMHTARSRNDQVALDMHLYLRGKTLNLVELIRNLQQTLLQKAKENLHVIMSGYTHLQRAQPILFSHHLLAYVSMLQRDLERLTGSWLRINQLPLGACALAGTGLPIDRQYVADLLKFDSVYENSIDAVSDRDFCVEFLANSALIMTHLSRLSEELILWSSQEFAFIELDDAYCTGSSIMPQKKNPDVPELIRGKTGRVYGSLIGLLTTLKGLPLAYNKDMQEDKEAIFDTVRTLESSLSIYKGLIETLQVHPETMLQAAQIGLLNATELADYLALKGVPFREAHSIVGKIVGYCLNNHLKLEDLSIEKFKTFSPFFAEDVIAKLDLKRIVDTRNSQGGTSSSQVEKQLAIHAASIEKTDLWILEKKEQLSDVQLLTRRRGTRV